MLQTPIEKFLGPCRRCLLDCSLLRKKVDFAALRYILARKLLSYAFQVSSCKRPCLTVSTTITDV